MEVGEKTAAIGYGTYTGNFGPEQIGSLGSDVFRFLGEESRITRVLVGKGVREGPTLFTLDNLYFQFYHPVSAGPYADSFENQFTAHLELTIDDGAATASTGFLARTTTAGGCNTGGYRPIYGYGRHRREQRQRGAGSQGP